jgi:hypothetical protein
MLKMKKEINMAKPSTPSIPSVLRPKGYEYPPAPKPVKK